MRKPVSLASLPCVSVRYSQLHCIWSWGFTTSSPIIFRGQGRRTPEPGVLNIRSWLKCHSSRRGLSWPPLGSLLAAGVTLSWFIFIGALLPNWYFLVYLSADFWFCCFLGFLSIISLSPYPQQHIISSIEEGTHLSGSMPHPQHPAQ